MMIYLRVKKHQRVDKYAKQNFI